MNIYWIWKSNAVRGPMRGGLVTSVRCVVVVQDAMRRPLRDAMRWPLRTGCIFAVRSAARSLHLRGARWLQLQAQMVPCFWKIAIGGIFFRVVITFYRVARLSLQTQAVEDSRRRCMRRDCKTIRIIKMLVWG